MAASAALGIDAEPAALLMPRISPCFFERVRSRGVGSGSNEIVGAVLICAMAVGAVLICAMAACYWNRRSWGPQVCSPEGRSGRVSPSFSAPPPFSAEAFLPSKLGVGKNVASFLFCCFAPLHCRLFCEKVSSIRLFFPCFFATFFF